MADTAVREFVDELVSEIEQGIYDKHLRGIARACYRRRGQLEDGTGVVNDPSGRDNLQSPPELVDSIPESATQPSGSMTPMEFFQQAVKAQAIEVPSGNRVGSRAFRWNGVRYYKNYIDGGAIYLDNNVRPRKYADCVMRIDDIFIEGTSKSSVTVVAASNRSMVNQSLYISRNYLMKQLLRSKV